MKNSEDHENIEEPNEDHEVLRRSGCPLAYWGVVLLSLVFAGSTLAALDKTKTADAE